jgi:hypothetical protein
VPLFDKRLPHERLGCAATVCTESAHDGHLPFTSTRREGRGVTDRARNRWSSSNRGAQDTGADRCSPRRWGHARSRDLMALDDLPQVLVTSRDQWRQGLLANAETSPSNWLVAYRRSSGLPAPSYDEVIEEALCFGWIDSTVRVRDEQSSMILLASRKPRSTWSALEKARVARLLRSGAMTSRGLRVIEVAQQDGSWEFLD